MRPQKSCANERTRPLSILSQYKGKPLNYKEKIFAVAPMMDWTDRHCRTFHRVLTRRAVLYTEMVTADAVLHGDPQRLLGFDAAEQPVVLQLGGSNPAKLAAAARIGVDFGYRRIEPECWLPVGPRAVWPLWCLLDGRAAAGA